jgi:hypothetical protein
MKNLNIKHLKPKTHTFRFGSFKITFTSLTKNTWTNIVGYFKNHVIYHATSSISVHSKSPTKKEVSAYLAETKSRLLSEEKMEKKKNTEDAKIKKLIKKYDDAMNSARARIKKALKNKGEFRTNTISAILRSVDKNCGTKNAEILIKEFKLDDKFGITSEITTKSKTKSKTKKTPRSKTKTQIFFDDDNIILGTYKPLAHMAYGETPTLDFYEDQIFIDSKDVYKKVEKIEDIQKNIGGLKCYFYITSDFFNDEGYAFPSVSFDEKELNEDKSIFVNKAQIQEIVSTINEMYGDLESYNK